MDTNNLVIETNPAPEDVRFLEDRLYEYNVEQTGVDDGQWLAIFVRDDHGVSQAGIEGWTWCGTSYIRSLWVHKDWRGQGVGTQLLRSAEQEARARGCQQIVLDSSSFQAAGFYQKLSYEVFAVLEEHPRQHRNYYLRKRLVRALRRPWPYRRADSGTRSISAVVVDCSRKARAVFLLHAAPQKGHHQECCT